MHAFAGSFKSDLSPITWHGPTFNIHEHGQPAVLWGLTARIVDSFLDSLCEIVVDEDTEDTDVSRT